MAQLKLFNLPKVPRQKPRRLMHVVDAGAGIDERDLVRFKCRKCNHDSGWMLCLYSEAKRGIPCPICNPTTTGET